MKRILYYQPDRSDRPCSIQADTYFEENVPCKFNVITSWNDFLSRLNEPYDLVGFHTDLFNDDKLEIIDFVKTISTMLKFNNSTAKIGVCIDDKCTQEMIQQLIHAGATGIIPGRRHWDLETATIGLRQCLEGNYWPKVIIDSLPKDEKTTMSLFVPEGYKTVTPLKLRAEIDNIKTTEYHSLNDLSNAIISGSNYIGIHIDMLSNVSAMEFMLMYKTFAKHFFVEDPPILIIAFNKNTHINVIKEYQKNGVNYFNPASISYGVDIALEHFKELIQHENGYYPRDIISKLPGNKLKKLQKQKSMLTGRQDEIYRLIARRGLSNKQIAKMLNISESTVKIHVSAIFKTLCVRNRTQLALTKI